MQSSTGDEEWDGLVPTEGPSSGSGWVDGGAQVCQGGVVEVVCKTGGLLGAQILSGLGGP